MKNMRSAAGKLGGRPASQLDQLRDEVRPLRRQVASQAADGRVQRQLAGRQFVEQGRGFVAREPVVIGNIATNAHIGVVFAAETKCSGRASRS